MLVWKKSLAAVVVGLVWVSVGTSQLPPDAEWKANGVLKSARVRSFSDLGAAQGVSVNNDKIYIYGDVYRAKPRVGVIREYDKSLKPTGRVLWLKRDGKPLLSHPTGLTWDDHFGCFVGDTVDQKARIYQIDWDQAWKDGNLDRSVKTVIEDDAATNGCRPEFVKVGGRRLLATADYGEKSTEIRLYDPKRLLETKRSSAKGVVVHKIRCGPFNQNLFWDQEHGHLVCIQNVVAGRGWQLDVIDLNKAVAAGSVDAEGARVKEITLPPHSELEGYRPLTDNQAIFVTAHPSNNVVTGRVKEIEPRESPRGYRRVTFE